MLCEEYTYPHIAESMVQPQGFAAIPLAMDAEGIVPCSFRTMLQSLRDAGRPLPRLLYTIPVGQNPTGEAFCRGHAQRFIKAGGRCCDCRLSACVRESQSPTFATKLTHKWLHETSGMALPVTPVSTAGAITPLGRKREIYSICTDYNILILEDDPYYYLQFSTAHGGEPKGLNDLGCSYLSMDTDSRVIRLDSFSKVTQP